MTPLIDGDILLHEMGWSGEFVDKDSGEPILLDFERVQDITEEKLRIISVETEATTPPIIFLSDNVWLNAQTNKQRKWLGEPALEYIPCFRYERALSKPYKGTRKNKKPFHFQNLIAYFTANHHCIISADGYEADDEMSIYQCENEDTIVCSRDKDLRITPGWHYSWECGKQGAKGPVETDKLGWLDFDTDKTVGYGLSFFYYQMLVGDSADNIPGLPGMGDKGARKILQSVDQPNEKELLTLVKQAYKDRGMSKDYFMEQADLLWIVQERGKGYEL